MKYPQYLPEPLGRASHSLLPPPGKQGSAISHDWLFIFYNLCTCVFLFWFGLVCFINSHFELLALILGHIESSQKFLFPASYWALPMFSLRRFNVLYFTFRPLIHLELRFVPGDRYRSIFILCVNIQFYQHHF